MPWPREVSKSSPNHSWFVLFQGLLHRGPANLIFVVGYFPCSLYSGLSEPPLIPHKDDAVFPLSTSVRAFSTVWIKPSLSVSRKIPKKKKKEKSLNFLSSAYPLDHVEIFSTVFP